MDFPTLYKQKMKDILGCLGYSDETIKDLEKEIIPHKDTYNGSTNDLLNYAANIPINQNFEVMIAGKNCNIEKDTDLYFKILDTISGLLINALDSDNNISKLEYLNNDKNFINYAEIALCQELHTLVKIDRVETWKDLNTFNDLIKIGILVMLDQSYIDNYVDAEAEELIKLAIG